MGQIKKENCYQTQSELLIVGTYYLGMERNSKNV